MYQTTITDKEAGQRFDKYLRRLLPEAGSGFIYKMLRKKNITLNGQKADGNEKIVPGDTVAVFFSDETLAKFRGVEDGVFRSDTARNPGYSDISGSEARRVHSGQIDDYKTAFQRLNDVTVLYENDHILLADKPAGVLSQKAVKTDFSLNEWLVGYLLHSGALSVEDIAFYTPSVCNRLDRNTGGIVLCAKSLQGAQLFGRLLKDRTLHKYYQMYVKGIVKEEQLIEGYLYKDEKRNKVYIKSTESIQTLPFPDLANTHNQDSYIKTGYRPIRTEHDKTLLEAELFTGKPHQIRAHLASVGHPLLGDYKYGDKAWNETYRKKFHVSSQLLHAYKVEFPVLNEPFGDISGRTFVSKTPDIFRAVSDTK